VDTAVVELQKEEVGVGTLCGNRFECLVDASSSFDNHSDSASSDFTIPIAEAVMSTLPETPMAIVADVSQADTEAKYDAATEFVSIFSADSSLTSLTLASSSELLQLCTPASIVRAILSSRQSCVADSTWMHEDLYGSLLIDLLSGDMSAQVAVLREVERHCRLLGFPVVETVSGAKPMLAIHFRALFDADIVDLAAFLQWCESSGSEKEDKGHIQALFQTSSFVKHLQDLDGLALASDEEEERLTFDPWRGVMLDTTPVVETPDLETKTAKELKKERRLAKVASRNQ
jgi:hypothetical protein